MTKKLIIIFIFIWLTILFAGRNSLLSYRQSLVNQEPVIRSYIDACVLDFPFSFCRLIYNKLTFAVPERILSFLDPLSVENILLKEKSIIFVFAFPFYLAGLFAIFWKLNKYFLFLLIVFTTLLISLLWSTRTVFYLLSLPIIFGVGIKEFINLYKK